MPYLLGLLGLIGTAAVILWRIKMAADAAKGIAEMAGDARKYIRRTGWQRRLRTGDRPEVSDPREAAAAMMAALAEADGALTERERTAILDQIERQFEYPRAQAEELLAFGRWLAKDVGDLASFLNRMGKPVLASCTEVERRELIGMLETVASADGRTSEIASDAIATLRRALGLAAR